MFSVDSKTRAVVKNPEYYVLGHLARFVKPGARVAAAHGTWAANALHFINVDGSLVWVLQNPHGNQKIVRVADTNGEVWSVDIPAKGFATAIT